MKDSTKLYIGAVLFAFSISVIEKVEPKHTGDMGIITFILIVGGFIVEQLEKLNDANNSR